MSRRRHYSTLRNVAFMGLGVVHSALVWCLACVCFFLLNIGGCLGFGVLGLRPLPAMSPFSPSLVSARRSLRLGVGAHGWRTQVCRPWGRNSV